VHQEELMAAQMKAIELQQTLTRSEARHTLAGQQSPEPLSPASSTDQRARLVQLRDELVEVQSQKISADTEIQNLRKTLADTKAALVEVQSLKISADVEIQNLRKGKGDTDRLIGKGDHNELQYHQKDLQEELAYALEAKDALLEVVNDLGKSSALEKLRMLLWHRVVGLQQQCVTTWQTRCAVERGQWADYSGQVNSALLSQLKDENLALNSDNSQLLTSMIQLGRQSALELVRQVLRRWNSFHMLRLITRWQHYKNTNLPIVRGASRSQNRGHIGTGSAQTNLRALSYGL